MIPRTQLLSVLALIGVALGACRPMPEGAPRYPVYEPIGPGADGLPGPFPYMEGDARLAYRGAIYESGSSEDIVVDKSTVFFDIFEGTFVQDIVEDPVEGELSAQITLVNPGLPWWGGGYRHVPAIDLSDWTTLHLSLNAPDGEVSFEAVEVLMNNEGGFEDRVRVFDYGFRADGEWHNLVIPLEDFPRVDKSNVFYSFGLAADSGPDGSLLRYDDVYFTQE